MSPIPQSTNVETSDGPWQSLYRIAAIAALIILVATLIDVASAIVWPTTTETVSEWFSLFQANWLLGLRDLGLLDMIIQSLNIMLFFAFYGAHRRVGPYAALATVIALVGVAVSISSNGAFPMLVLSRAYAVAADTQKPLLLAAGEAALAQGAHSSPGTFMGFLFTNSAGILMSFVMLRNKIFSRWTAWVGMLAFSNLLIFNAVSAFAPATYDAVMVFAVFGGLLFMAWHALVARRFLQLGQGILKETLVSLY